jgi:hypothetical protein
MTVTSTQSECVSECEASSGCTKDQKQDMIDCAVDMKCESADSFMLEAMSCSLKCPGSST